MIREFISAGVFILWGVMFVVQFFLGFGTAYRCTKKGRDTGVGLFIYIIGFSFAALVPGLGLCYYIKHLQPKIIVRQQPPTVVRIVETSPRPSAGSSPPMDTNDK